MVDKAKLDALKKKIVEILVPKNSVVNIGELENKEVVINIKGQELPINLLRDILCWNYMDYIDNIDSIKSSWILDSLKDINNIYDNRIVYIDEEEEEDNKIIIPKDDIIKSFKETQEIQKDNMGDNDYMIGMYNGMECLIALLEEREPRYKVTTEKSNK